MKAKWTMVHWKPTQGIKLGDNHLVASTELYTDILKRDSYFEWLMETFQLCHSKNSSLWEYPLLPCLYGDASSAVWPNVATWLKAVTTVKSPKLKLFNHLKWVNPYFWALNIQRADIHFSYLSCAALYLFNLTASSLFSSIHRCKSSSFSVQACANVCFRPFCSARRAANSLDWHSAVNSNSEMVAFRVFLPLARVSASWRQWDTLKRPVNGTVIYCTFDKLVVLLQTFRCWNLGHKFVGQYWRTSCGISCSSTTTKLDGCIIH